MVTPGEALSQPRRCDREACVRTLLPLIVGDSEALPALFAFEATVLELTFVFGPPLALGLGAVWSTGGALVVSGLVMLGGTVAFAAQPASGGWRPGHELPRPRGGSLPAIRTLILILVGTGTVFGATEVGVTAAARALGSTAAGGPLLALLGSGVDAWRDRCDATRWSRPARPEMAARRSRGRSRSASADDG